MRPMGRTLRLTEADARALFPDGPSAEAVALPTDLIDQLDDLFPTTGGTSRLADLLTACRAEHVAAAVGSERQRRQRCRLAGVAARDRDVARPRR